MQNSFLNTKKAQVGDTMTWLVATLIIVFVITISVLAVSISPKLFDKQIYLDDKKKDLLAAKSISGFLENKKNVDILNKRDYSKFEVEVKKLISVMYPYFPFTKDFSGAWNFELYEGEEQRIRILTYSPPININLEFESKFVLENDKLRFWAECSGGRCK
ncbi:hypothetical protein HY448_02190 [Candidatus Pacearchaeota archaeon]|nr:hypothetical protein [Candidatus Pacearchaeota archaeon]